ncbi:chemotaxis protein CheW [uncultured Desulfuromonas sp.]|uniref:chemotaxis protein CheW n=1 Tax=uncultured Desulfuromonas sp. TaxID=181013 RepID=UPI002AABDFAA|nr:chemotaxis protein CheW [uncultured Desulfuromonas sp.]
MSDEAYYKDVKVPKLLTGLINHMSTVEGYREELSNLGNQWDLLTILGQMSGTGMDMTDTRLGFQRLTSELLGQLGLETLKATVQEIGSKAQVVVDIVIRNLFERTADIGFLATDDDIRAFLTSATDMERQIALIREQDELQPDQRGAAEIRADQAQRKVKIVERFQEYVAKYSVYYNIILLDPDGQVLVQLDEENTIKSSTDPLLQEALNTHSDYVEAFRQTDLLASEQRALIYAYRVTQTNEPDSMPLGVLCLCFRFENEMEGVFNHLSSDGDWSVLSLLDKEGRVIASSDTYHIPLGAKMEIAPDADFRVSQFAGREYLSTTCATKGYQGYFGLGWYGHVMIPLEHAFDPKNSSDLRQRVAPEILDAVMNDPRLFSEDLRSIPIQADHIQHELERTVWNGNVRESDAQSKVLLWNISDAGARTKMVFEKSIGNLHETVVSGILNDVQFQAALAVDIMDRNLYERANDCRWWALTSAFRSILAQPERSAEDIDTISSILAYINGLYTVYTNLFVYDLSGRILAVSNSAEARIVGTVLSEDWVRDTLSLKESQCYSVSSFSATHLYDSQHTYIYGAAITDPDNPGQCVGGIGIVFDSTPQFCEMLRDSLPRSEKGDVLNGCFGVFADRKRGIISSTDERFTVGEVMDIDPAFFALPNGEGTSRIISFNGYYYAVGARTSAGYREYKTNDGYLNDVIAMVFVPLAEVAERDKRVHRRREMGVAATTRDGGPDCIELATFYIGNKWLGINAGKVKEAITSEGMTTVPGSHAFVVGKILYDGHIINVIDVRTQLKLAQEPFDPNAPIVVLETGEDCVGLVVDALGEIPEVCMDRVDKKKNVLDASGHYIECIIKPQPNSGSKELLVVIDPEKMVDTLIGTCHK